MGLCVCVCVFRTCQPRALFIVFEYYAKWLLCDRMYVYSVSGYYENYRNQQKREFNRY